MSDWDWTRIVFDHVHIRVRDAEASVAFYRAALEPLGIPAVWEGENGPPAVREEYSSDVGGTYYAAFVLDPDGNNIEAVRREFS